MRREPSNFATLAQGTVGAGGFYAMGHRVKAFVLRRPYIPEHTIRHTREVQK